MANPRGKPDVRAAQCATCIFHDSNPMRLTVARMDEIRTYLIGGTNHLCHTPFRGKINAVACRGGRDFQLQCWQRMGVLAEATDACLDATMKEHGFDV